nr:acyltransferase [uncultured Desulfuromonas sp.]
MSNPSQPQNRQQLHGTVAGLNGLRGIAVVLVFLFHTGVPGFSGAFIGVDIFFVLSGFLISVLLLQEYQAGGRIDFKTFYVRRVLRLLPALLFMLGVYLLLFIMASPDAATKIRHLQDAFLALFYASNWTRAFELGRPYTLGHCWSLSIEEQFYTLWPLVLLFLLRRGTAMRISGVVGLVALSWGWRLWLLDHGASWDRLYNGFGCRADMLLIGCLLACLWNAGMLNPWRRSVFFAPLLTALSFLFLAALAYKANWQSADLYLWQYTFVALAAAVIILDVLVRPNALAARILSQPSLVFLGVLSYAVYLWHYPVLHYCTLQGIHGTAGTILTAAVTLGFALLSRYLVEKPALRLRP